MKVTLLEYLTLGPLAASRVTWIEATDPESGQYMNTLTLLRDWGPPPTGSSVQLDRDWDREVEEWPQQRQEIAS